MVVGNCELILCLCLEEQSDAAQNAVGFTESSGFQAIAGLIFEEASFTSAFCGPPAEIKPMAAFT